jgi:hypothetical protein
LRSGTARTERIISPFILLDGTTVRKTKWQKGEEKAFSAKRNAPARTDRQITKRRTSFPQPGSGPEHLEELAPKRLGNGLWLRFAKRTSRETNCVCDSKGLRE